MTYHLHAVFSSLQGEGRNSGRPATFIRFSTCNLACRWCDTHKSEEMTPDLDRLLAEIAQHSVKSVIITGGEPSIQPGLTELVSALKKRDYWVALETNGLHAPACRELFDYIAVSPKSDYAARYLDNEMIRHANEVRIVAVSDAITAFCRSMRERIQADDYYISPLDEDDKIHYRRAMNLLVKMNKLTKESPPWSLSIQMHKVLGIR